MWYLQDDGSYNSGSTEDIMTPQNIKTGNIYIDFQSEWFDVRGYILGKKRRARFSGDHAEKDRVSGT